MVPQKNLLLLVLLVIGVLLLQPVLAAETTTTSYYTSPTTVTRQIVSATAFPMEGMAPLMVQFKDTSKTWSMYCLWNFGDGTYSSGNPHTVSHTYSKAGTYYVSLTIQDLNLKYITSQVAVIKVTSPPGPKAGMILIPNCTSSPSSIQCKDNSTGNPTSWIWNFGDGSYSTSKDPVHTYNSQSNGPIIISLTVSNQWGTDTTSQTIQPCSGPIGNFTANPINGCAPLTVCFVDQSIGDNNSYLWSFGDGSYSTGRNPCHTYIHPGTYTVTTTITDAGGSWTLTKVDFIKVNNCQVQEPILVNGCPPYNVQFSDTPTGFPVSWLWNFGDGTYSTSHNPVHTYAQCGNYTVTSTETYSDGTSFIKIYPVVISCICFTPPPTYTIQTWSQDGDFPAANVDVWYKKVTINPSNPTVPLPYDGDPDEYYLGKTDSNGVLSQVLLPDSWVVIRTQSPNYSKGCISIGGWYYTANNIVNVSEIRPKFCHGININLINRYEWSGVIPVTPVPTVTFTVIPTVTTSISPTIRPWP